MGPRSLQDWPDVGPYRPSSQDDQSVSVLFYVCSQKGDITQSKNKWGGGGGGGELRRRGKKRIS